MIATCQATVAAPAAVPGPQAPAGSTDGSAFGAALALATGDAEPGAGQTAQGAGQASSSERADAGSEVAVAVAVTGHGPVLLSVADLLRAAAVVLATGRPDGDHASPPTGEGSAALVTTLAPVTPQVAPTAGPQVAPTAGLAAAPITPTVLAVVPTPSPAPAGQAVDSATTAVVGATEDASQDAPEATGDGQTAAVGADATVTPALPVVVVSTVPGAVPAVLPTEAVTAAAGLAVAGPAPAAVAAATTPAPETTGDPAGPAPVGTDSPVGTAAPAVTDAASPRAPRHAQPTLGAAHPGNPALGSEALVPTAQSSDAGGAGPVPVAPTSVAPLSAAPAPVELAAAAAPAPAAQAVHTTPAPVQVAAPVEVPVAEQLAVRLGALRTAPLGEHVLTMRVEPDSIGPVRVVAHIAADGVRIELLGASDHAREALRAALPDLRRDLAAAGLSAQLDLGDLTGRGQGAPGQEPGLMLPQQHASGSAPAPRTAPSGTSAVPAQRGHSGGLDLEI